MKVNYDNRYIKSDRMTDRHTWFFVMFGFWLVDFFGILNPFQSTGTSLIMSTTSLICKIHYVMTYLLKKIYLLTKIQFAITYVAYNFFKIWFTYIFTGKWKCTVLYHKLFLIGYEVMNVLRFVSSSAAIAPEKSRNSVWLVSAWICRCVMTIKSAISL